MKKLICLFLSLMMLFGISATAETAAEGLFTPGTYTAEAQGLLGTVTVQITVTENRITGVKINAQSETPTLGGVAAEKLCEAIVKAQTPNVDIVGGATVTSNAIIEAATKALTEAGADIAVLDANRRDQGGEAAAKEENRRARISC